MVSEEPDPGADLRLFGLAALAAYSLFDDTSLQILVSRWVRLARERAALTVLPIALAFLAAVEMYAGRTRECEDLGRESLEISAATGNPGDPGAASRGDVSLLAWRGDEAEARASAAAQIAEALKREQFGTANFVRCALLPLDLGLRRYQLALDNALPVYKNDPPFLGSWVLPNLIEAAVRSGNEQVAREALSRLGERASAGGTPLARGFLARSRAMLAAGRRRSPSTGNRSINSANPRRNPSWREAAFSMANGFAARGENGRPATTCAPRMTCSHPWSCGHSPTGRGASSRRPASTLANVASRHGPNSPLRKPRSRAWPDRA
jgi:hypothetical protein